MRFRSKSPNFPFHPPNQPVNPSVDDVHSNFATPFPVCTTSVYSLHSSTDAYTTHTHQRTICQRLFRTNFRKPNPEKNSASIFVNSFRRQCIRMPTITTHAEQPFLSLVFYDDDVWSRPSDSIRNGHAIKVCILHIFKCNEHRCVRSPHVWTYGVCLTRQRQFSSFNDVFVRIFIHFFSLVVVAAAAFGLYNVRYDLHNEYKMSQCHVGSFAFEMVLFVLWTSSIRGFYCIQSPQNWIQCHHRHRHRWSSLFPSLSFCHIKYATWRCTVYTQRRGDIAPTFSIYLMNRRGWQNGRIAERELHIHTNI